MIYSSFHLLRMRIFYTTKAQSSQSAQKIILCVLFGFVVYNYPIF